MSVHKAQIMHAMYVNMNKYTNLWGRISNFYIKCFHVNMKCLYVLPRKYEVLVCVTYVSNCSICNEAISHKYL